MANVYLQTISDAKRLPESYEAMGTTVENHVDSKSGEAVEGWQVCQIEYRKNVDAQEWWINDTRILVDRSGRLWKVYLPIEYDPSESPAKKSWVSLTLINGEMLRGWHQGEVDKFKQIRESIEAMLP